jgi:hypothetical protein
MKTENILILFPTRKVGSLIVQALGPRYRVLLMVLSQGEEEYYNQQIKKREKVEIAYVKDSVPVFWDKQKASFKNFLSQTRGVLYFMGTDWLSLRIDHKEEDWAIDHARMENKKFAMAEKILASFDQEQKTVWINLAYGRHRPDAQGKIFCNTRYGLTGFLRSIELEPRLKNLKIVNICLNYFREQKDKNKPVHCEHCVSEALEASGLLEPRGDDFVSLIIRSIKRL